MNVTDRLAEPDIERIRRAAEALERGGEIVGFAVDNRDVSRRRLLEPCGFPGERRARRQAAVRDPLTHRGAVLRQGRTLIFLAAAPDPTRAVPARSEGTMRVEHGVTDRHECLRVVCDRGVREIGPF